MQSSTIRLWDKVAIGTLVKEIKGPINILVNPGRGQDIPPSAKELQGLRDARLNIGSGFMKATLVLIPAKWRLF